jgi:transcriptional regulator with XRE-family HTH domain
MGRSTEDIARRLVATQQALELSAAELCRRAGLSENQWSQYTNPKAGRPITRQQLYKLKDAFGITFEWVYDGDPSRLPHEIAVKLRKAQAA